MKILTKQYDEVRNIDNIEVNVIGKVFEKNKDIYVVYEETEDGQKVTTTLKISDEEVSIKKYGNINSLNASVAAAVLMYEISRQRQ